LVRVYSSGVNPSDVKSRAGRPLIAPAIIPHSDGAGIIEAVGSGVATSRVGERVWLWNGQWQRPMGTCATFIALPSEQAVPLPSELTFEQGACLGIPALTAYEAIRWAKDLVGNLKQRTVLIIGAANGVGSYAVQMAKQEGAIVIGTVGSAAKAELAQSLGADHLIDYKTSNVAEQVKTLTDGKGVDVIIDMDLSSMDGLVCGGALAPHGAVVCYGSNDMNQVKLTFKTWLYLSVTLKLFLVYDLTPIERENALAGLSQKLNRGLLRHTLGERFGLHQIVQAHEAVEKGLSLGNVVINMPD
jgi:NADPH2:quinone reductase